VPFVGAPVLPVLGRKIPLRFEAIGIAELVHESWFGDGLLPVRFDCPPEVTLLTLRSGAVPVSAGSRE